MRVEFSHCLILILLLVITHEITSARPRARININSEEVNCTEPGVEPAITCNCFINGTYNPCVVPPNNNTVNNDTCFGCPLGTYSNNDTIDVCNASCPFGSCIDPSLCVPCAVGYYSNTTNSTQCEPCSDGYVSREMGAENCTACSPGFTSTPDHHNCAECPSGKYADDFGTPNCLTCGKGSYSNAKAFACTKCPKGTYNSQIGQSFEGCKGCGQGFYGQQLGLTSQSQCIKCPAGSYCPDTVTVVPVKCPRDSYCEQGSIAPVKCSLLYQAEPGKESCRPGVSFYLLIVGCAGLAIISFLVVWRWRVVRLERMRQEHQQTEIDRLIPKPRDGPVYSGF